MGGDKLRVLVVDDSAICRIALRAALESDPEIEVVGEAEDGEQALEAVARLQPSLITLDLIMPRLSGIETIERVMRERPTPILVVTDQPTIDGEDMAFAALSRGALDLLPKATAWRVGSPEARALVERVKAVARSALSKREPTPQRPHPVTARSHPELRAVAIGASTGGPTALATVLKGLPRTFGPPVAVVQHMDASFHDGFVQWLKRQSSLPVRLAEDRGTFEGGTVWVAPAGVDLVVRSGRFMLLSPPKRATYVPNVDRLFFSVAEEYGATGCGVLLTGMGDDGARGLKAIYDQGGLTLAQDEKTSVIYGMPRAAVVLNAVERVLPQHEIASALALAGAGTRVAADVNNTKIVIVDDSPVVLEATAAALEEAGYTVIQVLNPLTLPAVMRRERPDLVLLDVKMPAVSGDVAIKILGAAGEGKVVLYSDLPEAELKVRAKACGALWLKKSDAASLRTAVQSLVPPRKDPRA